MPTCRKAALAASTAAAGHGPSAVAARRLCHRMQGHRVEEERSPGGGAADGELQDEAISARLWGGGRAWLMRRVCEVGPTHCGRRLRGGADPAAARLEQLRKERFGEDFGTGTEFDSSGIFQSGDDSLVVLEGNESEERARQEKQRRGLLRKPKAPSSTKGNHAPALDTDNIFLASSQDLYDSEPRLDKPRVRDDLRGKEARAAALAQDTIQEPVDADGSPEGSQAEESGGDGLMEALMPKPFWWETETRKGEPLTRHPLLSEKTRTRASAYQFSESWEGVGKKNLKSLHRVALYSTRSKALTFQIFGGGGG